MTTLHRGVLDLQGAKVFNEISKEVEDTKGCRVLFAGFPCTDASSLNKASNSSDNRHCIEDGSL